MNGTHIKFHGSKPATRYIDFLADRLSSLEEPCLELRTHLCWSYLPFLLIGSHLLLLKSQVALLRHGKSHSLRGEASN